MACQWTLLGFTINILTTLTTCEIFGWVQVIAYKMLPTILAYRTLDICFFLSSISGDKPKDNLKWTASGELTS
jgi:hypothetical protein